MSDEKQRLVDDFIDDWLASIDSYRQHIDRPENPLQRFAVPLGHATTAVRQARGEGDQQVLLFSVVLLAKLIVTVQSAFSDWAFTELNSLDREETSNLDQLLPAALSLAAEETARLVGLAAGRKTQQEKRQARDEKLRAEFERLRKSGMSAARAAEILSKRFDLHTDTIRKRFR